MSAMSLEAEKNELIRRILDVDDVAISLQAYHQQCRSRQADWLNQDTC